MTKICLIDSRVNEYQVFIDSSQSDVFPILIDYQNDNFNSLLDKIKLLNVGSISSIAYVAHGTFTPTYSFFKDSAFDMNIESDWQPLFDFLTVLKPEKFDFLGCSLASNNAWQQVFGWINKSGVTVRASTDNTGNLAEGGKGGEGGNWILEDGNVDAKALYFTDAIQNFDGLLVETQTIGSINVTSELLGGYPIGITQINNITISVTSDINNVITISDNIIITSSSTITVATGFTLTLSGVLSGTGDLTTTGPGTLILSGNNTFSGSTTVNSGLLKITGNYMSSIINNSSSGIEFNNSLSAEIKGAISTTGTPGPITVSGAGNLTISGVIGTSTIPYTGSLIVSGTGTVTFSGDNRYFTGTTTTINNNLTKITINNYYGCSSIIHNSNSGIVFNNSTNVIITGMIQTLSSFVGNITVSGLGTTTFLGAIGTSDYVYPGNIILSGTGAVTFSGDNTYFTGTTTINSTAGLVTINNNWSANGGFIKNNSINGIAFINLSDTTLNIGGIITKTSTSAAGPITISGSGPLSISAVIGTSTVPYTGSIILSGTGAVTFSGDNRYFTGSTTINAITGALSAAVGTVYINGNYSTSSIANNSANGIIFNNSSSAEIKGAISGPGPISISSTAKALTFSGNNSYVAGSTTINSGAAQITIKGNYGTSVSSITNNSTNGITFNNSNTTATTITISGNISGSNPIYINQTSPTSGNNTTIMSGNISGGCSISIPSTSTGIITFSGYNSFTGSTSIISTSLATVYINGNYGTSSIANNSANGIIFNNSLSAEIKGSISGSGPISISATAKALTFSGNNSAITGTTTINSGAAQVTINGNYGTTTSSIINNSNNGILFNNASSATIAATISGPGPISISATAKALTFSGNNSAISGTTTINSGAAQVTIKGNYGTLTSSSIINGSNNGILFNNGSLATIAATISGPVGLTKTGAGVLTLSGANTYTGTTTISGGYIVPGCAENSTSGPFGKPATAAGSINCNSGGIQYNSFTTDYSSRLTGNIIINTAYYNQPFTNSIIVSTIADDTGNNWTIGGSGTMWTKSTYSDGNCIGIVPTAVTNAWIESPSFSYTSGMVVNFSHYKPVSSGESFVGLEYYNNVTWTLLADYKNNSTTIGTTTSTFANVTVTIPTTATKIRFRYQTSFATSQQWLIDNVSIGNSVSMSVISGTTLTKTGAGVLTLSGANTYTGTTTISGGTLQINGSISLSSNCINNSFLTFNNSSNTTYSGVISGSGSLTKTGAGVLTLSGNNTFIGATTISDGSIIISGNYASNLSSNITFNNSNTTTPITYSGILSGTSTLTKTGDGVLTLSGVNTYTGTTNISGNIIINTGAIYYQPFTNPIITTLSVSTIADSTGNKWTIGGSGTMWAKYTNTNYSDGNCIVIVPTVVTDAWIESPIFSYTSGMAVNFSHYKPVSSEESIVGLEFYNNSFWSLSRSYYENNTDVYGTTSTFDNVTVIMPINTIKIRFRYANNANNFITGQQWFIDNVSIVNSVSMNGDISGTGSLTKNGPSVLTLSGVNTYTGDTTISGGTLKIGNNNAISGNITVNGATSVLDISIYNINIGTLSVSELTSKECVKGWGSITAANSYSMSNTNNTIINAILAGTTDTVGLNKSGAGVLTLTCVNTYAGTTTINSGQLSIFNSETLTMSGAISGSGNITTSNTAPLTISGTMDTSYTGSITILGSGALTFSGNKSFTTGTTISPGAGLVTIGNGFSSPITNNSGNGILFNSSTGNLTILSAISGSGPISISNTGTGTLTMSGAISGSGNITTSNTAPLTFSGTIDNTYTGSITISGSGALTFSGNKSFTTGTTISSGAGLVQINNNYASTIINGSGTSNNNGILFNNGSAATIAGAISGPGPISISGSSTTMSSPSSLTNFTGTIYVYTSKILTLGTTNYYTNKYTVISGVPVAPAAPSFSLGTYSSLSSTAATTNVKTVSVPNIEANSWEYSINSTSYTAGGTGTSFTLNDGTYSAGSIKVRQTYLNGSVVVDEVTNASQIVVDTTPSLLSITNNTTITVYNLEYGATWDYSTNFGTDWTTGTGTSFNLLSTIPATFYTLGQVQVRQTDLAGNTSSANTSFPAFTAVDTDTYTYSVNTPRGPSSFVNTGTGETGIWSYSGTSYSGTAYNSSIQPTNAGNYTATVTVGSLSNAKNFVISKESSSITISMNSIIVGNTLSLTILSKTGSTGAVTYSYTGINGTTYTSSNAPTAVGSYFVTATVAADDNFSSASFSENFNILPLPSAITISKLKSLSQSDLALYKDRVITVGNNQYTVNCPTTLNGNLAGLTYDYTVDISSIQSSTNKNFIIFIDDKDVLIGDSIYKSNSPVYHSTIGSITKKTATGYVSFNNPISISINSAITYYFNLTFGSYMAVIVNSPNPPCFNENTKILCLNEKSQEEYIAIQNLKKGDLVKTYLHGYKKIVLIGNNTLINNPNSWTKCMYRMKKEENEEDLIVTGGHSILVDELNDIDKTNQKLVARKVKVDGKLLLWAGQSSRFEKLNDKNKYTYYHLVLEDEKTDNNRRYGIYANGVLAETTEKRDFVKSLNELN